MAMTIILQPVGISVPFQTRTISLSDGGSLRLGRTAKGESEELFNALFFSKVVSTRHAIISYLNSKLYVKDTSRNGTFLNGRRIRSKVNNELQSGDILELGMASFIVEVRVPGIMIEVKFKVPGDKGRQNCKADIENCELSLYFEPPCTTFPLEELMDFTNQRYKILQVMRESYGNQSRLSGHRVKAMVDILDEQAPCELLKLVKGDWESWGELISLKVADEASHFCLRLACSRSFEAHRWFLRQESILLLLRWSFLTFHQKDIFLRKYCFHYEKVSESEYDSLREKLAGFIENKETLYRVKYTEVSELLRNREVIIDKSWAYIKHEQIIFAVITYYWKYLKSSLEETKKKIHLFTEPRLFKYVKRISEEIRLSFFKFTQNYQSAVKLSDLNKLSKESYPLCMEVLHYNLLRKSHLRNSGRFQYNLFLKGIGLSLADAILFWKTIFLKKMSLDLFVRKYLYGVRHGYGKLGKLADYPPLNCSKILESTPGPLDYHGCPFITTHKQLIANNLTRNNISSTGIEEVWELMEKGLPQVACARVFELSHSVTGQPTTEHPNIYFQQSRHLRQSSSESTQASRMEAYRAVSSCHCISEDLEW